MFTLDKLVNTALLGTERQPFAMLEIFEGDNAAKVVEAS